MPNKQYSEFWTTVMEVVGVAMIIGGAILTSVCLALLLSGR